MDQEWTWTGSGSGPELDNMQSDGERYLRRIRASEQFEIHRQQFC